MATRSPPSQIPPGGVVVLHTMSGFQAIRRASASDSYKLNKKTLVTLETLVGQRYGAAYRVEAGRFVAIDGREQGAQRGQLGEAAVPEEQLLAKDNRHIGPASEQGLSEAQVSRLQAAVSAGSASSEALVAELKGGLAGFDLKTAYSQTKYVARKRAKHSEVVTVHAPTTGALFDSIFLRSPAKLAFLREDTLALLLAVVNVRPGANFVVVDNASAVVIGSMLERMGGAGSLTVVGTTSSPSLGILGLTYWGSDPADPIRAPLGVTTLRRVRYPQLFAKDAEALNEHRGGVTPDVPDAAAHGLVVVTKDDPFPITLALLPKLAVGEPFAVFFYVIDPLVALYAYLTENNLAFGLRLVSSFLRYHQVLPDRTHPEVNMHNAAGYVLHGYYAGTDNAKPAPPPSSLPTDSTTSPTASASSNKRPRDPADDSTAAAQDPPKRTKPLTTEPTESTES